MNMPGPKVLFFDLGDTLGVPRFSLAGALSGFDLFPLVPDLLAKMKAPAPVGFGARLGVISNTPSDITLASMSAILTASGVLGFFDPSLLLFSSVEGQDKTQKSFFTLAATRAGVPAARCVFVGESDAERIVAKSAGFATSFHPLHAFQVLKTLP